MTKIIWYISVIGLIGLTACSPKSVTTQEATIDGKNRAVVVVSGSGSTGLTPTEEKIKSTETSGDLKTESSLSLKTAMGELTIVSVKFVDEVNDVKPGPDDKILLVGLSKGEGEPINPGNLSLEEFQAMVQDTSNGGIYILGDDGSKSISPMAGWVAPDYKEFAMGFRLPKSVNSYTLIWPGNNPLTLIPSN